MLSGIFIERPRLALVIAIVITLAGPEGRPCVRPRRPNPGLWPNQPTPLAV